MPMDSGEAIPLEMFKGEPIPLTSQDLVSENDSTFEVKKEEAKQEDSNK